MKKLYECNPKYAMRKLWNIRMDIRLNSLYYADYENRYGYDTHMICDFFDSYLGYLADLMADDGYTNVDRDFFDLLPKYDNKWNLWCCYQCYEIIEF